LLSVFRVSFVTEQVQFQLTCAAPTMFIAIPAAVDNNGAATLDASLSVDKTIEDNISNVRSTASESGPEFLIGLS
jgi:hypothetical protein